MKILEDRFEELQRIAKGPNGLSQLCLILSQRMKVNPMLIPHGTPLVQTILEHEYPDQTNG